MTNQSEIENLTKIMNRMIDENIDMSDEQIRLVVTIAREINKLNAESNSEYNQVSNV